MAAAGPSIDSRSRSRGVEDCGRADAEFPVPEELRSPTLAKAFQQQDTRTPRPCHVGGQPRLVVDLAPLVGRLCAFVDARKQPPSEGEIVDRLELDAYDFVLLLTDPRTHVKVTHHLAVISS